MWEKNSPLEFKFPLTTSHDFFNSGRGSVRFWLESVRLNLIRQVVAPRFYTLVIHDIAVTNSTTYMIHDSSAVAALAILLFLPTYLLLTAAKWQLEVYLSCLSG